MRTLMIIAMRRFRSAENRGSSFITLNLRSMIPVVRNSLCTACVFSHIVRGYQPLEELIVCGFAFPREISFPVRECTDFRAERVQT